MADNSKDGGAGAILALIIGVVALAFWLVINSVYLLERVCYVPSLSPLAAWTLMGAMGGAVIGTLKFLRTAGMNTAKYIFAAAVISGFIGVSGLNLIRTDAIISAKSAIHQPR